VLQFQNLLAGLAGNIFKPDLSLNVVQVTLQVDQQIYQVLSAKAPSIPTMMAAVSNPYLSQLFFRYLIILSIIYTFQAIL